MFWFLLFLAFVIIFFRKDLIKLEHFIKDHSKNILSNLEGKTKEEQTKNIAKIIHEFQERIEHLEHLCSNSSDIYVSKFNDIDTEINKINKSLKILTKKVKNLELDKDFE